MKKILLSCLVLIASTTLIYGQENKARQLLDEVSAQMAAYSNMTISFNSSLSNEDAGIQAGDEPPIKGIIALQGEKYNLTYLGNTFLFDGSKLYVINHEEKEIAINEDDLEEDDGFIYPSKLFTFYKEGYTFELGPLKTIKTKKIQYVTLTPMDSDSDIVKVEVGIDKNAKQIIQLIQTGANNSKTTFEITSFKHSQNIPTNTFSFDKDMYLKQNYIID